MVTPLTPVIFSEMVQDFADMHEVTHLDAIEHICERQSIEVEMVASLLTPKLRAVLTQEAKSLRLLANNVMVPSAVPFS